MDLLRPFRRTERRTERRGSEDVTDLDTVVAGRALELAAGKRVDVNRLAAAESCAGLYARSFASAIVDGTSLLAPDILSMMGRALLFKGEFLGILEASGMVVPASLSEVLGKSPNPREWGYRLHVNTPAGQEMLTVPASSILHVRINASVGAPWRGRSPLKGAMNEIELAVVAATALANEARTKPLAFLNIDRTGPGSQSRLTPEQTKQVASAIKTFGPGDVAILGDPFSADRIKADPSSSLNSARQSANSDVCGAAGVPAVLLSGEGDGTTAREAYRRFTRSTIEPLGRLLAHEASRKLEETVTVRFDNLRASDVAMNARAFAALVGNDIPASEALELSGLLTAN